MARGAMYGQCQRRGQNRPDPPAVAKARERPAHFFCAGCLTITRPEHSTRQVKSKDPPRSGKRGARGANITPSAPLPAVEARACWEWTRVRVCGPSRPGHACPPSATATYSGSIALVYAHETAYRTVVVLRADQRALASRVRSQRATTSAATAPATEPTGRAVPPSRLTGPNARLLRCPGRSIAAV